MDKPRIALLPPRVWHSTWGQEKNLVQHLAQRFRIDVLDLMDFGGRHRKAGPNRFNPPPGVRLVERPQPPGLVLQGLYLELANGLRVLFGRYDLLITYLTLGGVLAVLAARLRGIKVLLIYADDYVAFYQAKSALAGRFTARVANPLVASLAHGAAATARLLAQDIRPHNSGVEVIPNGTDAARLAQVPEKKGGEFTVGFVGGFGHWIDFPAVLEAARFLPGVRFVLVGGGDMFDHVADQAQGLDNLSLTGQVNYDRVINELARMDVCLIPFKKDGLTDRVSPIKLFEYWAAARPVISSPIEEVVRAASAQEGKGPAALFYEPGNGTDLARAIRELQDDPETGKALAREGKARLKAHDWSEIIKSYWAILDDLGFGQGD